MDFVYQVTSAKPFDEAVAAVQAQTQANGFRVLHVHDVQATLAEKNFVQESLKIVEVCNAKYAYTALQTEITVSLLMPCRINVYVENGLTMISTMKPTALVSMFQKPELESFAQDVEAILTKIINESK